MDEKSSTQAWPGAFGIYKRSKEAVLVNVYPILGVIALYLVASIILSILLGGGDVKNESNPVKSLADLVVSSAMTVAITLLVLAGIRGQKMEFGAAVKSSLSFMTIKVMGLSIVLGVIAVVSLLLLIVPFFFIVPRLVLAPYFLIDKKLGIFDSISASWDATKGSLGKVWGVIGVSVLFGIAIIVLVGLYLSLMYAAAFGLLYLHLAGKSHQVETPSA